MYLGIGRWVAGVGAGAFEELRWVDLEYPAGGDVWARELEGPAEPAGRVQVKLTWTPPSYE